MRNERRKTNVGQSLADRADRRRALLSFAPSSSLAEGDRGRAGAGRHFLEDVVISLAGPVLFKAIYASDSDGERRSNAAPGCSKSSVPGRFRWDLRHRPTEQWLVADVTVRNCGCYDVGPGTGDGQAGDRRQSLRGYARHAAERSRRMLWTRRFVYGGRVRPRRQGPGVGRAGTAATRTVQSFENRVVLGFIG